jgi:hypothetical protein
MLIYINTSFLFIYFFYIFFWGADLTFILRPIWLGADLTRADLTGNLGITAIESFLSNTFCIISFCSDLSCRWNCLSCRIRLNVSSSMWFECCLRMQIILIIWRAALSSSHHTMRCCHHSVSIVRSRLDFKMEVKWRNNRI